MIYTNMISFTIEQNGNVIQLAVLNRATTSLDTTQYDTTLWVRSAPTADSPRPRWITFHVDHTSDSAAAAIMAMVRRKLPDSGGHPYTTHGAWITAVSETDATELQDGVRTPNGLFTKVVNAITSKPAAKTWESADLAEASKALLDGPIKALVTGGDLTPWTVSAFAPAAVDRDDEEIDEALAPVDLGGGKMFVPTWLASVGMSNTELFRTCRRLLRHILIGSDPGTGKTWLVNAAFPGEVYAVEGGDRVTAATLLGQDRLVRHADGSMEQKYFDGLLTKAVLRGGVLFVDEASYVHTDVFTETLFQVMETGWLKLPDYDGHPALEPMIPADYDEEKHGPIDELPKAIKARPGFFVVFAYNPDAPGSILSEALISRAGFRATHKTNFDLVASIMGPEFDEVITIARNLRERRDNGEMMEALEFRDLIGIMHNAEIGRVPGGPPNIRFALEIAMTKFRSEADREIFRTVVSRTAGVANLQPLTIF